MVGVLLRTTIRPARRKILLHQSSLHQKRPIFSYLSDVFRSGNLSPTNPFLESIEPHQGTTDQKDEIISTTKDPDQLQALPDFTFAQPHHVSAAAEQVHQLQKATMKKIQQLLQSSEFERLSAYEQLDQLIRLLNEAEEPGFTVLQLSSLLADMSSEENGDKSKWNAVAEDLDFSLRYEDTGISSGKLKELLDSVVPNNNNNSSSSDDSGAKEIHWAVSSMLRKHESESGERIFRPLIDETETEKSTRLETYEHLSEALVAVSDSLLQTKLGNVRPQLLSDMYNFIGLKTEQAKMLGYSHFCEQVFAHHRQATFEEIQQLHKDIAARIVPQVIDDMGIKKSQEEQELETYLGVKDEARAETEFRHKMDRYLMLKMQEHVTLDGALKFVFRVSQDLFGLSFVQDKETNAWNKDVLLYHVFDETANRQYMGSFYIDPFQREGKLPRSAAMPLFPRGKHRQPVVNLCLQLEAPAWDDDSPRLRWQECETVFHEFGHVLQFMLSKPTRGTLLGPHAMAFDISEFLPKFMELFLTEKSTLFQLIDLSKSNYPLSDEEVELAFKVRAREKALQLAHLTFNSSLELALFSGFNLKGSETIVALQERLGKELIPHDVPDPEDVTPLLDILQTNARGQHVGEYRYIWCDALSAVVFERFKETYATDPGAVPALGQKFRRLVLEPGAVVDVAEIRAEFGFDECSPNLLCDRYGL